MKIIEQIQSLEKKKIDLTTTLNSGITDHIKLQEIADQIQQVADQIESKTFRWLELSEVS